MRVFNNYIICKEKQSNDYTSTGVYKGLQKEKPIILEVIEIGDKVSMWLEQGDVVLVSKFSGTTVEINDEELIIIRDQDVVAKLEKGEYNEQ